MMMLLVLMIGRGGQYHARTGTQLLTSEWLKRDDRLEKEMFVR